VLPRVAGLALTIFTTVLALVLACAVPRAASAQSASPLSIQATLDHNGGGTATMSVNASSSTTFTLTNVSGASLTINLTVTTCSGSLVPGSCTRTPTSVTLADGADTTISSSFSSGAAAGAGTLTLTAKNTGGTTLATATVAVTVTATAHAPTVSDLPHLGDRIEPALCVADCFETTFGYATPAYVSFDTPRSVALLYRSGRAKPYGRVSLDATDATGTTTAFRLRLMDPSGVYVTFTNDSTSLYFAKASSGATRVVGEFDAGAIATSAKLYTAYVTSYDGSTPAGTTADTLRVIIVNGTASVFGAGVDMVGFQRLYDNASQAGGVLITDGSGAASFFRGSCTPAVSCTYTSPGGDFSVLTTGSNQYKRTYPDGTVVTFDATGNETSAVTRFGAATSFAYSTNVSGKVVPWAIGDGTGKTIDLRYRSTSEAPYQAGSLTTITAPTGGRRADFRVYTASGNLEQVLDFDNLSYGLLGYDAQHRLTSVQNKKGGTANISYAYGRTPSYVDAPSVTISTGASVQPRTQFREAYSGLYSAAATGGGRSATSKIPVPAFDIRAAVTDPLGNSTFFSINRFGSSQKTYAPIIGADSSSYDAVTGQLKRYVSPVGAVTKFTWSADKLTQTYDSTAGKTVNITYETGTALSLPNHIYGDVMEQWFTYDHNTTGLPLTTSTVAIQGGPATTYTFDTYGRPLSVTDPSTHTTSYGYEATGLRNRISVTAPNSKTTTYTKDGFGRDTMVTDPYGRKSKAHYDVLNRPTFSADAAADTTRFQYDLLNALTVVTDQKAQTYTTARNALGWPVTQTDPGSRVDTTKYDAAGHVVYVRTRALRKLSFEYDALGRITKKLGQTSGDSVKYVYDPQSRWVKDSVFNGNTLVSVDSIVTDSVGRPTGEFITRPGVGSWRVSSVFNQADPGRSSVSLLKPAISPDTVESQVNYTYDASKRLSGIQIPIAPYGYSTFGYDAENFPSTVTFQNGQPVETTTHTADHAESMRSYSISAIDTVLRRWYHTDSLLRITQRGGKDSLFQNFSYDNADRLKTWVKRGRTNTPSCVNDNSPGGQGYTCTGVISILVDSASATYDAVGNPTGTGTSVVAGNRLQTFNGYTMTYDNDGNMLTRVGPGGVNDTYTWDDFGQLKSVTRSGIPATTFAYDGFGRRIRKTSTIGGVTQTIQYIWDGDQIFAEVDGSGVTLQTYSYNPGVDQPRTVTAGGQVFYMSTGFGGDVNGLIKRTDNSVAALYKYTPWGELETDQQYVGTPPLRINSFRWHGLAYDSETGLYQVRARYYDPATRRFISEDPIGLGGGINQYAFANADPVNGRDPSGLCQREECPELGDPFAPDFGGIGTAVWNDPYPLWFTPISTRTVELTKKKIAARGQGETSVDKFIDKMAGGGTTTQAFTLSGVVPMLWGVVGPAGNLTVVPSQRLICLSTGLGISPDGSRSISGGAVIVHAYPGKAIRDVLSGWSVSGGYNWTPVLGVQGSWNTSGYTVGYSAGFPGGSASLTSTDWLGGCANY
jgi:RHS repeat-associated protein